MRGDAETKIASRQVLVDELDVQAAQKRGAQEVHDKGIREAEVRASKARSGDRDIGMGVGDAEGEDTSTPAGTTPAIGTPAVYEEEDLFGDDDDSVMEGDAGTPRSAYLGEDEVGEEMEEEEDEMARMLRESMMGGGDDAMGASGDVASPMSLSGMAGLASSPAPGQGESDEMAAAALANFADAEGMQEEDLASVMMRELEMSMGAGPSGSGNGFGVEGGVGMRRLASGLAGDDDDDSSDDSDD